MNENNETYEDKLEKIYIQTIRVTIKMVKRVTKKSQSIKVKKL